MRDPSRSHPGPHAPLDLPKRTLEAEKSQDHSGSRSPVRHLGGRNMLNLPQVAMEAFMHHCPVPTHVPKIPEVHPFWPYLWLFFGVSRPNHTSRAHAFSTKLGRVVSSSANGSQVDPCSLRLPTLPWPPLVPAYASLLRCCILEARHPIDGPKVLAVTIWGGSTNSSS